MAFNPLGLSCTTSEFANRNQSLSDSCSVVSSAHEAEYRDLSQGQNDWWNSTDLSGYEGRELGDSLLSGSWDDSDWDNLDNEEVEFECEGSCEEELYSLLQRIDEEDEGGISPILSGLPATFVYHPQNDHSLRADEHYYDAVQVQHPAQVDYSPQADHAALYHELIRPNHISDSESSDPPPYFDRPLRLAVPRKLFPGGIQELEEGIKVYLELRDHWRMDSTTGAIYPVILDELESLADTPSKDSRPFTDTEFKEEPRRTSWNWREIKGKMGGLGRRKLRSFFSRRRERTADNLLELAMQVY